jgi:hypothetical protein
MDKLYEYGINARWDVNENWDNLSTDAAAFLHGVQDFPLFHELCRDIDTTLSVHTLQLAGARWALDGGEASGMQFEDGFEAAHGYGELTVTQIALLANMDEKSVRNAANPKNKEPLVTRNVGTRTVVDADNAKEWLAKRRGFKVTEYFDSRAERDLSKVRFYSMQDLEQYVKARREKLDKKAGQSVASAGTQLEQWVDGALPFDVKVFTALADELRLNRQEFIGAAFALRQKLERKKIEDELQQLP